MHGFQHPRLAQWYIAALTLIAVGVLCGMLFVDPAPFAARAGLALTLTGLYALTLLVPIQFNNDSNLHLDTTVLVAAILLFVPAHAMVIVGMGTVFAYGMQRKGWARILFNASLVVLEAAIGGLLLEEGGWSIDRLDFGQWQHIALIVIVAGILDLITYVGLAILFALRAGQSPITEYWQLVRDEGTMGRLVWLAQVAIGLLAGIVADTYPWAIALLVLPAAAVHYALSHQVRLRLRVEQALHASEANLAAAQRIAHLGSWEHDQAAAIMRWSDETYRLLGYVPGEITPTAAAFLAAVHPDDRARVADVRAAAPNTGHYCIDYRIVRADGTERRMQEHGERLDHEGAPRVIGTVHDITNRHALETRLAHQAFHDPLTGLANRALFNARLREALHWATQHHTAITLLFLDLDGFKEVNDRWGHDAGDRLLIAVSERLGACVRAQDMVARLGGDEFAILLTVDVSHEEALRIAERMCATLENGIVLDGYAVAVSASIGIVHSTANHNDPAVLLHHADAAMYQAKRAGKARVVTFDPTMAETIPDHVPHSLKQPHAADTYVI